MRQHRNSQERKYKPSAPDSKPTRGQSMNAEPEYIYLPKKNKLRKEHYRPTREGYNYTRGTS